MKILLSIIIAALIIQPIFAQTINVMGYEQQSTIDCIEDWIENEPYEYEGSYVFIHFGHHTYIFYVIDGTPVIEENFESLTDKGNSLMKDITIDGNMINAIDETGRDFNARFVNLKCDINSEILEGFHGMLVDEELLYIMRGD